MRQFIAILAGLGLATGMAYAGEEAGKKSFSDLDTNRDGVVSRAELAVSREMLAHFQKADRDSDGRLTPTEFNSIKEEVEEAE